MKGRCLISLLLPLIFFCVSCTQQPETKALPEKIARENPESAKKKPLKIIHVAGEMISVNPKMNKLSIRGKDGDVEIYATAKTVIHIGGERSRLSDVAAGNKATVKYLEIGGKNIARSIFIVQEDREEKETQKTEIPSLHPPEKITPDQPSDSQKKSWPPS